MLTDKFKIGDTVFFSGHETLLCWDRSIGNMTNVYFGHESGTACGIIIDIKEDPTYGGEAEIYSHGEILILPWRPGFKPELQIYGDKK